jgi:hypothetical protein
VRLNRFPAALGLFDDFVDHFVGNFVECRANQWLMEPAEKVVDKVIDKVSKEFGCVLPLALLPL